MLEDGVARATFYALIGLGAALSVIGLIMLMVRSSFAAQGTMLSGTLLFILAAMVLGFAYLDPSPED